MRSLLRIGAILGKEVRQLSRDHLTFGMIVGIPLMQILLFGYAINLDVRHLSAGVADQAGTQLSRKLVADTEATQVIDVVHYVRTVVELEDLLRRGEITIGILIPPDFERRVRDPARPAAQLLVDGSDPVVATSPPTWRACRSNFVGDQCHRRRASSSRVTTTTQNVARPYRSCRHSSASS